MKKSTEIRRIGGKIVRFVLLALAIWSWCPGASGLIEETRYQRRETPMHKVQLTQKGYIQFLRWELPVPEITEFTFCLWIESNDLTHPHSIFSYSKDERDRLARCWISAGGTSVHLEIGGKRVFASSSELRENRWYHVCVGWENRQGRYALWVDGQPWTRGRSRETTGHRIPSGGDIVLGQEYTDFDKGLEDGIEGSVFGFNLLLASAFDSPRKVDEAETFEGTRTRVRHALLSIVDRLQGRRRAQAWRPPTTNRTRPGDPWLEPLEDVPYGLQLVKLTYAHCRIGRGSPPIGGPSMLISWTRTPVRVFGGATLKNANSDCGNF